MPGHPHAHAHAHAHSHPNPNPNPNPNANQALTTLAETKVSVRGVAQQGGAVQKAMTPAVAKYKDWAGKNRDAAFVADIEVTFDPTPLAEGIGGVEVTGFGGKINLNNTLQSRLDLAYQVRG